MGAGDAAAHDTRAQNPDPLDRFGLNLGVGYARILLQSLGHEKHRDEITRNRTADERRERFRLDFESFVKRQIATLFDGIKRGQRSRELSLGLSHHLASGDSKNIGMLIFA